MFLGFNGKEFSIYMYCRSGLFSSIFFPGWASRSSLTWARPGCRRQDRQKAPKWLDLADLSVIRFFRGHIFSLGSRQGSFKRAFDESDAGVFVRCRWFWPSHGRRFWWCHADWSMSCQASSEICTSPSKSVFLAGRVGFARGKNLTKAPKSTTPLTSPSISSPVLSFGNSLFLFRRYRPLFRSQSVSRFRGQCRWS